MHYLETIMRSLPEAKPIGSIAEAKPIGSIAEAKPIGSIAEVGSILLNNLGVQSEIPLPRTLQELRVHTADNLVFLGQILLDSEEAFQRSGITQDSILDVIPRENLCESCLTQNRIQVLPCPTCIEEPYRFYIHRSGKDKYYIFYHNLWRQVGQVSFLQELSVSEDKRRKVVEELPQMDPNLDALKNGMIFDRRTKTVRPQTIEDYAFQRYGVDFVEDPYTIPFQYCDGLAKQPQRLVEFFQACISRNLTKTYRFTGSRETFLKLQNLLEKMMGDYPIDYDKMIFDRYPMSSYPSIELKSLWLGINTGQNRMNEIYSAFVLL